VRGFNNINNNIVEQNKHIERAREREITLHWTKRPQECTRGVSAPALAAQPPPPPLGKWHRAAGEITGGYFKSPPSCGGGGGEKDIYLLSPKVISVGPSDSLVQQFCARVFLFLYRNNSIPWIHLFLFPSSLSLYSSRLSKWSPPPFFVCQSSNQKARKKKPRKTKADEFLFFSFFFFFNVKEMRWKKRKCNGLPASTCYPVASYIPRAATSVPFKWPPPLYCVHIRYKLWWMLYRSYSAMRPQSRRVIVETSEAQMIRRGHRPASPFVIWMWGITSKCTSTCGPTAATPTGGGMLRRAHKEWTGHHFQTHTRAHTRSNPCLSPPLHARHHRHACAWSCSCRTFS